MNPIHVTVAMPAYNAEQYIRESIESVLSQDYDSFELLICDDCSKDNTWKTVENYKNHPGVRIFRNNRNLGVGATRNKLLRLTSGKYITPCDADDIMLPGNLKRLSGFLNKHSAYAAVYGDILVMEMGTHYTIKQPPYIAMIDNKLKWDIIQNLINHSGSMMRIDSVKKVGGYNEKVYSIDDWDLWLKLAEIAKIKYLQGEIYYVWRRHSASLTRTDKKFKEDYNKIISEAIERRYGIEFKG